MKCKKRLLHKYILNWFNVSMWRMKIYYEIVDIFDTSYAIQSVYD